ncbi:MAG: glycosyltransferase family 2 protein [Rhizobacter sp.]|nr:glycosyltransferase family 2 protein [Rhizobacter sp.]
MTHTAVAAAPGMTSITRFVAADEAADLSVVLVNYNTAHLLERCLGRLRAASQGLKVRVVIVDNASRDGSAEIIRAQFPDCVLIANPVNVGFGRANNQALAYCNTPFVLLLNADAYVYPDTLHKCLQYMKHHPRCGVLGVRLVDEQEHGSYTGRNFPDPWKTFLHQTGLSKRPLDPRRPPGARPDEGDTWQCDWVVGCYYMTRREVIDQVGLFDPRYFLYFEEVDHCLAVKRAGWTVECLATAQVIHVGGGSAETEGELSASGRQISALQIESELLYFRKHRGLGGLVATVTLSLLADAIRALKWVLKLRPPAGLAVYWRNSATVCRLAWQTRLGTRATR